MYKKVWKLSCSVSVESLVMVGWGHGLSVAVISNDNYKALASGH